MSEEAINLNYLAKALFRARLIDALEDRRPWSKETFFMHLRMDELRTYPVAFRMIVKLSQAHPSRFQSAYEEIWKIAREHL